MVRESGAPKGAAAAGERARRVRLRGGGGRRALQRGRVGERGERLSSLEGATQQMALQAESLASMATQLNEREQSRSMFPWS